MTTFDRRRFLALSGLSAFGAWMGTASALAAQTDAKSLSPRNLLAAPRFASTPFALGVASGDPAPEKPGQLQVLRPKALPLAHVDLPAAGDFLDLKWTDLGLDRFTRNIV
jgi:hypothetical protein